ncbi:uncharacterized protein LOC111445407 isoform X3 [Cucurbita moschata]|uniref:Uncharacterized protein LOC111445407 isoform X3 n=1 Tax=Cucurbita moschata TaxID=3662 RepID=A0A6J1FH15_CUCMO|nr:uncharacterized protein LOC111445407 isoform X3 [Cucurbita moschata]
MLNGPLIYISPSLTTSNLRVFFGKIHIGWITDSFEHFSARIVVRFGGMFRIIQAFDMIDFACGVIRISNKCYCREIFDQRDLMTPYYTTARACLKEQRDGYGCCTGKTQVL